MSFHFRLFPFAPLFVACLVCGCGGGKKNNANTTVMDDAATQLKEVAAMIEEFCEEGKVPQNVGELLRRTEVTHPAGGVALRNKECVVLYGVNPKNADPSAILAYRKDVPTEGGKVITMDGTVKEMTADEFKAASKAKKF